MTQRSEHASLPKHSLPKNAFRRATQPSRTRNDPAATPGRFQTKGREPSTAAYTGKVPTLDIKMYPSGKRPDCTGINTPSDQIPHSKGTPTKPCLPFTRQRGKDSTTPDGELKGSIHPAFRDFLVGEPTNIPGDGELFQSLPRTSPGSQTPPTCPTTPTLRDSLQPNKLPETPPRDRHRSHILPRPDLCRQFSCPGHPEPDNDASSEDEIPCSQHLEQRDHIRGKRKHFPLQ